MAFDLHYESAGAKRRQTGKRLTCEIRTLVREEVIKETYLRVLTFWCA